MTNDGAQQQPIELSSSEQAEFNRQLEVLEFGTLEITPRNEFDLMLKKSIKEGIPLRVKCGIDPTSSDVHLGHTVQYRKMRQFQDLGHIGVVIIGDYTASIGDPSGKDESRPPLSKADIELNARTYMDQIYTVLDKERTELFHQTEWFEETSLRDVLGWASQTTIAKLLGHETFRNRLDQGNSLALNELFYPVLQGIDSVYVKADVELGGSDQRFNVLMGRDYQKLENQRPQVAMLLPLLTGTCGSQKMSKSLGNYIGIYDEPFDKFGKIMSIPDDIMIEYYQYLGNLNQDEFFKVKKNIADGQLHPNEAKKQLASHIVSFFHGQEEGQNMREKFESVFKNKNVPDDVLEFEYTRGATLVDTVVNAGIFVSKGEVRRLIKQNAVGIVNGKKINDIAFLLDEGLSGKVVKFGKRKFVKLV